MNHNEWLERAEIYALGALDGEELSQFEAHVASGCRVCENHIRETRETLSLLPRSLAPVNPPASIKAQLLRQIAAKATTPAPERVRFKWLWWGGLAGALAAAGLIIALSWTLYATQQELRRLQVRFGSLETAVAQQEDIIQFLSDPQVRPVRLSGLEPSPKATGQLLWNPVTRQGLLLASGLPAAAPDKIYELWAISGKEPIPAGLFAVDEKGRALLRLPALAEGKGFDKFAVTLEPAGGVPKPTGPMHLIGNV